MCEFGLHFRTGNFRSNFASWTFFQFSKHSLMFLLSLIIFTWLAPVWYKNPGKNDAPPRAFHFPRELVLLENGCWEEKPKWIRALFPQNSLILLLSALFFCFRQRPRGKHLWIRAEIRFRQFAFSIFFPTLFFPVEKSHKIEEGKTKTRFLRSPSFKHILRALDEKEKAFQYQKVSKKETPLFSLASPKAEQ